MFPPEEGRLFPPFEPEVIAELSIGELIAVPLDVGYLLGVELREVTEAEVAWVVGRMLVDDPKVDGLVGLDE